jgi:type II secretion system protein G
MKFRCPHCKHVFENEPSAICPNCKKALKIPENLKESVEKIKEAQGNAPPGEPVRNFSISSGILTLSSPVFPILVILIMTFGILMSKWDRSPYKYSAVEFSDPKTLIDKAKVTSMEMAKKELKAMRMAIEIFKHDCGRYPETKEGIMALINNPGIISWKGPYVTFVRLDPWKSPYQYISTNGTMRLFSCGPDQQSGTADDVIPADPTDRELLEYDLPLPLLPTNTLTDTTSAPATP